MKAHPHILYIEDNEYNQRLIRKIMEPSGFSISRALDGIQGIKKAEDLKPDLILVDLDLPYLDGLGVAAKTKSIPGLEKVPIIALTCKTSKADRNRALVAGCDGWIEKPIDARTFADQIRTYLEGKRELHEPVNKTQILKDFNVDLIDQLRGKIEELEEANRELTSSKEALQTAYQESQESNIELQRLNRLKENIMAISSHELRTPLSVANGYLDLLLEGMLGEMNENQQQPLRIAKQSLSRMSEIIGRVSDLGRLALKKLPLNFEELDLNGAFAKVYDDLAIFMKIRRLDLKRDLSKGKLVVLADKNLIHQVFTNLLKNAICFTPDGGEVKVSSWARGKKAFFAVADSGIGLLREDVGRIFDEFYQVHEVTHHKTGHFEFMTRGIGVGLALCKGIIGEMGGKIRVESKGAKKGSTFTFYLPLLKK